MPCAGQGPVARNGAFFFFGPRGLPVALAALALLATADAGASTHAPALLLRTVIVAIIALCARDAHGATPDTLLRIAAYTGVAAATWGVVLAENRWLATQTAANAILVVILFWTLTRAPHRLGRQLLQAAGALGLLHVAWAVAQRATGTERAHGGFFSPNDLAAYLAPCAVFSGVSMVRKLGRARLGYAAASLAYLLGILASGSRAGLLAAAMGGALFCAPWLRRGRFYWPMWAAAAALAGLCFILLHDRWTSVADPYAYSRWDIWKASLRVFVDKPWGVGIGGYADALRIAGVPLSGWVRYPRVANNAHNEWLQSLVECGLLGGVAALAAPLAVGWRIVRGGDARRDVAVWMAFVVPALTTTTLHLPPVAFLAALWATVATHQVPTATPAPWAHARGVTFAAIGALLLTVPSTLSALSMDIAVHRRDAHQVAAATFWADISAALNPDSAGAAMLQASLRFQQTQAVDAAAATLVQLAEQFPQNPDPDQRAAKLLASVSYAPAQWAIVAKLYESAAQRDPHNALRWCDAAEAQRRAGDAASSEHDYTQALSQEPNCARALSALAAFSEAQGDKDGAAAFRSRLQAALEQAPHTTDYLAAVLSL